MCRKCVENPSMAEKMCTCVAGVDGSLDRGSVDGEVVRLGAVGRVRDHILVGLGRRGPVVAAETGRHLRSVSQ